MADDKPMMGEIIPPTFNVPTVKPGHKADPIPRQYIRDLKVTVDMLGLLQDGEDEFFRNWGEKWRRHKEVSGRDESLISNTTDGEIIATSPENIGIEKK